MKDHIIQLRITLRDVSPPVWRRVQVPAGVSMRKLHEILNAAMGWDGTHLHSFEVGPRRLGRSEIDRGQWEDDRRYSLGDVAEVAREFDYEYDFGDGWSHEVKVEGIFPADPAEQYPVCVAGENACPPEDCGGPPGFEDFKVAMGTPKHPARAELVEWYGGTFDPSAFALAAANKRLGHKPRTTKTKKGAGKSAATRNTAVHLN